MIDREQLAELSKTKNQAQIGQILGVSQSSVSYYQKKWGIEPLRVRPRDMSKKRVFSPLVKEEWCSLY